MISILLREKVFLRDNLNGHVDRGKGKGACYRGSNHKGQTYLRFVIAFDFTNHHG